MTHPALNISPEKMKEYRQTARAREEAQRQQVAARRERAWAVARRAAEMLKTEFGASRVVLFGSLTRPKGFHLRSDIDLAVWGLDEPTHWRALGRVLDLEPTIEVDLVQFEEARPALQVSIAEDGVAL